MKLLLDTHVWLWWNTEPERLSTAVLDQIRDPGNEVFLSAASTWEMAIKRRSGKLPLPEPVARPTCPAGFGAGTARAVAKRKTSHRPSRTE